MSSTSSILSMDIILVCALATLVKILLIPSYTSTDFEVHRNWLAITNKLPFSKWYFENTSEWTLDYPPFFAWFEAFLSKIGQFVDSEMVKIENLNYKSNTTLYFQRCSVIFTDFLLFYSSWKCANSLQLPKSKKMIKSNDRLKLTFVALIIFNCGLFIVDHIHFQYNGFLFGLLFLSIANIMDNQILPGALWFAVLLNFKHIFLYIAPAYGVFLLRSYCMDPLKKGFDVVKSFSFIRFFTLGCTVIACFCLSLGPFYQQLDQLVLRLFPFKRGLTHAYWAPNMWAMYNFADIVLLFVCKHFKYIPNNVTSSMTGGMVQSIEHNILPTILPLHTFIITILFMLPCLIKLFFFPLSNYSKNINQFLYSICICAMTSFMFGWHVHEKAILTTILPFTLLAFKGTNQDARVFLILQNVGHYSLFPLLFTPLETVTKYCLAIMFSTYAFSVLPYIHSRSSSTKTWSLPLISKFETVYIFGLAINEVVCNFILPFTSIGKQMKFLPLMITSTYCAIGVIWCWILLYRNMLMSSDIILHKKDKIN